MTAPVAGIAYSLWLRMRWGIAATLFYLAALATAARVVPNAGELVVLPLLLMIASVAHLLQVFRMGPADLGVRTSGFPANMFVLPLETRSLSGCPIALAAATFAGLWVLIVYLVLMPAGFSPPVLWPAAVVATACAWAQAISWSPFPTPRARAGDRACSADPAGNAGRHVYGKPGRRGQRDRGLFCLAGAGLRICRARGVARSMRHGIELDPIAGQTSLCPSLAACGQPR